MSGSQGWAGFSADPREPDTASIRATDADRDHALDLVREAYADGRLNREEFDARSADVLEVRTLGEVIPLLRDLVVSPPLANGAGSVAVSIHTQAVREYQGDLRDARNGWIFVSTLCVGIWVATSIASGGPYFFWPIFPSLGVGLGFVLMRFNREARIEALEEKIAAKRRRRRRRKLE